MADKTKQKHYHVTNRFSQFVFLTVKHFNQNNLWESSSSCSFGFVFSFIPILMIIITVLATILQNYPSVLNYVLTFAEEFEDVADIKPFINNMASVKSFHIVDIFLAVWVVWMARKLFISIVYGMNRIFRSVSKRKSFLNQLITFLSEFVLIIIIVTVILATFILNKIIELPFLSVIINRFPHLISPGSNLFMTTVVYSMLYLATLYAYKFMSGTKPAIQKCAFYALISCGAYFAFSYYLNKTINTSNYNIIYGTISTLVVLMLKVYFFFVIFLAGAQMVYVSQFFSTLLKSEIYLMPENSDRSFSAAFKRKLFINPSVLQDEYEIMTVNSGEVIYAKNEDPENVYYIKSGCIAINTNGIVITYHQGEFFGEVQCILNQKRNSQATAVSQSQLLVISSKDFKLLLKENPKASEKALSKVTEFFATDTQN